MIYQIRKKWLFMHAEISFLHSSRAWMLPADANVNGHVFSASNIKMKENGIRAHLFSYVTLLCFSRDSAAEVFDRLCPMSIANCQLQLSVHREIRVGVSRSVCLNMRRLEGGLRDQSFLST